MTSLHRRLFGRQDRSSSSNNNDSAAERVSSFGDVGQADKPYVVSSIVYLLVIFIIGVPMWFYTCSATRYSLPNLSKLEDKLIYSHQSPPKLHLDVSIIQLSRYDSPPNTKSEIGDDRLTDYLRTNLPPNLATLAENITYEIDWRVRRPTHDENNIFSAYQKQHDSFSSQTLTILEENLIKIHKPSNKFRLFMFLIEQKYYPIFCNTSRSHSYTLSFERFVYLCPSQALGPPENYVSTVGLINDVMREVYSDTVDIQKVKHILSTQMDLLFSLLPELYVQDTLESLSIIASKIHHIYNKNVKEKFPELKELVNIRLITQNVIDLLDDKLLSEIIKKPVKSKVENETREEESRTIQVNRIGKLFNSLESRLNKHSSQNVHNALLFVADKRNPAVNLKRNPGELSILEGDDKNTLLVAHDDKSLVLQLRAVIRRLIGLSSGNICKNCLVRRDVFFNRWELDAVMGILTMTKIQDTYISLKSISNQVIGIKIPKDVATMANGAHDLVMKSLNHLDTKRTLESYRSASKAYELSETAYYDPSLLESLYFPDDLKYAIYLPLFLPLALPITMSIIRLSKYFYISLRNGRN